MLQTEESSMILKKKDTTLCELNCVTSPRESYVLKFGYSYILQQWKKTQQKSSQLCLQHQGDSESDTVEVQTTSRF